jgi:MFS family permease
VFEEFYSTFATVSLTVTGLWMYVASSRYRDWLGDRDHFRRASAVSVQLAFPGLMCMFALINPASTGLWRVAFGVSSGIAIVLLVALIRRSAGRWARLNEIGNWIAVAIFAGVTFIAITPEAVTETGMADVPRRAEFFLFSMLLVDGLVVAWTMLFSEAQEPADR